MQRAFLTFLHVFFGRQHERHRTPTSFYRLMEGSQTSLHATPGHCSHAIRPSLDIATPLFYSNITSSTQSLWKFGTTTHHQKGKRLQRQAKEASFVCNTVARFGLSTAASPGGDGDPPPRQTYPISSHLRSAGTWRKWAKTARRLL